MKTIKIFFLLGLAYLFLPHQMFGQGAVYIYKNPRTGEGDYMLVYGMPSEADAEFLCQEKLIELGYAEELVRKQASTSKGGYGMVIKSTFQNKYGRSITVFGASLGCKSKEQAEKEALENLQKFNNDWVSGTEYVSVQKFVDN